MGYYVLVPEVSDKGQLRIKKRDYQEMVRHVAWAISVGWMNRIKKVLDDPRVPDDLKEELMVIYGEVDDVPIDFEDIFYVWAFNVVDTLWRGGFICEVSDEDLENLVVE